MNHAQDFLSTTIEKINDVWVGSSSRRRQRRQARRDNKRLVNDQTIINSNGSNMLRSSVKDNRGSNISERSTSSRRLRKSNEKRSALLRRHKRLFSSRNLMNQQQHHQQSSSGRLPEEPPPLPSADKPVLPLPAHHHHNIQYHHNQSSKSSGSFDDDDDDDDDSDEQRATTSEGTPLLKNVIHKQASRRADKNEEGRIFDSTSTAGIPSRVLPRRQEASSASISSTKVQNPHWKALQEQVQKGNFLVAEMISGEDNIDDSEIATPWTNNERRSTSESTKSIEKLRYEAIENFQKGSTFSPQMCLLAILLYMIGAVFMFCFLFEPQWTVIDSCYFAVSTFTTLGKSNQSIGVQISFYTTSDNYPLTGPFTILI